MGRQTTNKPVVIGTATLLAVSLVLVVAPGSRTAGSEGPGPQLRRGSVRELAAGKLLVAARNLPDPNFSATVILLVHFNREGAMGLIVNRPTTISLSRMLPGIEQASGGAATAFVGGPVAPSAVLALLSSTKPRSDSRHVVGNVHLVNTRDALNETIAAGVGPDRFRVYAGYAGWGAGQLEHETAEGAWHVLEADDKVVFDPDPASLWRRQIKRTEVLSVRGTHGRPPARGLAEAIDPAKLLVAIAALGRRTAISSRVAAVDQASIL